MITENLALRNIDGMSISTVRKALSQAKMIVFVCEAQRRLYKPTAPSRVIYAGVPGPDPDLRTNSDLPKRTIFTILSLGIVCPRKNQMWAVEIFKSFAVGRQDVRLVIVGARRTRLYEIEYLECLMKLIDNDQRIEVHNVAENVDKYYQSSDCLLFTSTNEVTPLVICEVSSCCKTQNINDRNLQAMAHGLPILSTNIAGIPEMVTPGVEGFLFAPNDTSSALKYLHKLDNKADLRFKMGRAGKSRFESTFDLKIMIQKYKQLTLNLIPPVLLIDMDGTLVDWDASFNKEWAGRSIISREQSYYMEECVPENFREEALQLPLKPRFFQHLDPMPGGIQALLDMENEGFRVFICTSPLLNSKYCAQEKLDWISKHLGPEWLKRTILTENKAMIRGDLLIDDKPFEQMNPNSFHQAAWKVSCMI